MLMLAFVYQGLAVRKPELNAGPYAYAKAGFGAFSHYRTVVGTDLPFSVTGRAAPPFSGSTKAGDAIALRMARTRTRRRLKRPR